MNLLKKFMRTDTADVNEDYEDMYVMPDDLKVDMSDDSESVSSLGENEKKTPDIRPASADKVSVMLLQPESHVEAPRIADKVKEGCIVLLDVSNLTKEKAHRLVDFLAGVAYVLGGEMIKTNRNTIVVAPAGVDITSFAPAAKPAKAPAPVVTEEIYEEIPDTDEN